MSSSEGVELAVSSITEVSSLLHCPSCSIVQREPTHATVDEGFRMGFRDIAAPMAPNWIFCRNITSSVIEPFEIVREDRNLGLPQSISDVTNYEFRVFGWVPCKLKRELVSFRKYWMLEK